MKAKRPESAYTLSVEPGGNSIIGIPPGHSLSIALAGGKVYHAPIEWVHAAVSRRHLKANPGKPTSRRLLSSSEQMKGWKDE